MLNTECLQPVCATSYQCSMDRTIDVETYHAPVLYPDLIDSTKNGAANFSHLPAVGSCARLPVLRKRLANVECKSVVLCVHGLASNRHVFDAGSGRGGRKSYSFMEYLALSGYDVWAMDLRGTREALLLGCKRPKGIREFAEKDVPSVIALIGAVCPHLKIILVGHSMGAAVCCAVAGHSPDSIRGVVHLAGLYNLTLPPLLQASLAFERLVPSILQTPLILAAKLSSSLLLGNIGRLVRLWDDKEYMLNWREETTLAAKPPVPSSKTVSSLKEGIEAAEDGGSVAFKGALMHYLEMEEQSTGPKALAKRSCAIIRLVSHLRRLPIPLRPTCDLLLSSVPIQQWFHLDKSCVELLAKLSVLAPWAPDSIENPWKFMDLTVENPTLGLLVDILCWHGSMNPLDQSIAESCVGPDVFNGNSLSHSVALANIVTEIRRSANPLDLHLQSFERHPDLPMFFVAANHDRVICNSDSHAGFNRARSRNKVMLEYVHDRDSSAGSADRDCLQWFAERKGDSSGFTLSNSASSALEPLANLNHGERRDSKIEGNENATSAFEKSGACMSLSKQGKREGDTEKASELNSAGRCEHVSVDHCDVGRVTSSICGIKGALLRTLRKATSVNFLLGNACANPAKRRKFSGTPEPKNLPLPHVSIESLKGVPKYSVSDHVSYGHCDILGGKNAEEIWAQVVRWMDHVCFLTGAKASSTTSI